MKRCWSWFHRWQENGKDGIWHRYICTKCGMKIKTVATWAGHMTTEDEETGS